VNRSEKRWHRLATSVALEGRDGAAKGERAFAKETGLCAPAGRQLAPEWPCLAAMIWHSRLQNHTTRHRPQRSSLASLLPHAWHEARSWRQRCRVHTRRNGARPGCVWHARRHLGCCDCTCSIGGTAVGAGVALSSGDDLALAAAEPRVAAPTAAQQLASVLAACVARVWRHC